MSEQTGVNFDSDDGEPPSSGRVYRENYETGELYDARLSEYMAVKSLTAAADAILEEYGDVADGGGTMRARKDGGCLLRTPLDGKADWSLPAGCDDAAVTDGRTVRYCYAFWTNEQDCRTWEDNSEQLSWCYYEHRHEPAEAVEQRLREVFPLVDETVTSEVASIASMLQASKRMWDILLRGRTKRSTIVDRR